MNVKTAAPDSENRNWEIIATLIAISAVARRLAVQMTMKMEEQEHEEN